MSVNRHFILNILLMVVQFVLNVRHNVLHVIKMDVCFVQ